MSQVSVSDDDIPPQRSPGNTAFDSFEMVIRDVRIAGMPLRWWRMSWSHENTGWNGILVLVISEVLFGGQY